MTPQSKALNTKKNLIFTKKTLLVGNKNVNKPLKTPIDGRTIA